MSIGVPVASLLTQLPAKQSSFAFPLKSVKDGQVPGSLSPTWESHEVLDPGFNLAQPWQLQMEDHILSLSFKVKIKK